MSVYNRTTSLFFAVLQRIVKNPTPKKLITEIKDLSRFDARKGFEDSKYKCIAELLWDHPKANLFGSVDRKRVYMCAHCGCFIDGIMSDTPIAFCSRKCAGLAKQLHFSHAKRVSSLTHFITKYELFIKDDGVCGICGDEVEMANCSIDHIVPVSKKGSHVWDNVQLSHYACNMKKGANELNSLSGGEKCVQGLYLYQSKKPDSLEDELIDKENEEEKEDDCDV